MLSSHQGSGVMSALLYALSVPHPEKKEPTPYSKGSIVIQSAQPSSHLSSGSHCLPLLSVLILTSLAVSRQEMCLQ